MSSRREQILQELVAALKAGVLDVEGRVYRSDPEGTPRDLMPCINVTWSNEVASPETVPQLERTLTVSVSILVRGDEPDALADPIAVAAHAAIMASPSFGGLAIDTRLEQASFEMVSADGTAGRLTHEYSVKFRHSYADMTT